MPDQPRSPEGRREFFRKARSKLRGGEGTDGFNGLWPDAQNEPELKFDGERIVARTQGQKGWLREAERQLEQRRWHDPEPIPRSRSERSLGLSSDLLMVATAVPHLRSDLDRHLQRLRDKASGIPASNPLRESTALSVAPALGRVRRLWSPGEDGAV